MLKMVLHRLAFLIFVVFGVTLITFLLSHVIPGDPAGMMAGQHASSAAVARIRHQLGLDGSAYLGTICRLY
ncbi:hypothetical protein QS257_20690 [Terrilactibacillus sp. S3-3]|nr:hypothetical protein QS257_20690 [Terrilactibacillus sp. S3-3]